MIDLHLYRPPKRALRRTRRVIVRPQRIGELVWHPNTWSERLEAWEWRHPLASAALTLTIFLLALVVLVASMFLLEPRP